MKLLQELLNINEGTHDPFEGCADFVVDDLKKLPQPFGVNGGSYTYWVDLSNNGFKVTSSDGQRINAKSLRHLSRWLDKTYEAMWKELLDGDSEVSHAISDYLIKNSKKGTDQQSHEKQMRESYHGYGENNVEYQDWIKRVKKLFPNATVTGTDYQAQMVDWTSPYNEVAGDWDGKKGVVYKPGSRGKQIVESVAESEYFVSDVSNEEDHTMVLVLKSGYHSKNYYGVNVLFYNDGKIDASTADADSAKQWEDDRDEIIKIASKYK